MKSFTRSGLLVLLLAITLIVSTSCRTRTRVQPQPQPTPVMTDTVGTVDPVRPSTDVTDEPEFVDPSVDSEELPADDAELNRLAQARGWIRDAFFNYDESTLTPDAQEALTMTASWLRANPNYNVTIEGHCDERGTEQYNLALGDRRANIARDYLATLGIDSSRMRTVSYGEERPFQTGTSEAAHAANRRAHIVVSRR